MANLMGKMMNCSLSLFARLSLLLLLALCTWRPGVGQADSLDPRIPETPPRTPAVRARGLTAPGVDRLSLAFASPLKAVVFVGPIDGNEGNDTLVEIESARQTAAALRSYGVSVQEFYPNQENGTWENIKAAAVGANFLIYRGHGVYWSDMPYPIVGGFALRDRFVSNEMIRAELRPAENFIVMLYGCFTAGSAGNDTISLSLEEARRRVAMYSDPFFDIGAGGYYADWFGDAFTQYVHSLFQGKTQGQAYEAFYDYNSSLMWRGTHPDHPSQSLWLGWDNWYAPLPNWNNAFAGDPAKTLSDLFDSPSMVLTPTRVTYLAESGYPAKTFQVTVDSTSASGFEWALSHDALPAWLTIAGPAAGSSGQAFTLTIDPAKSDAVTRVTLQIDATTPQIGDPSQQVTVSLQVVSNLQHIWLPAILR